MANKRKLHHISVQLRSFRTIYIIIALIISIVITANALRQNNLKAIQLRDAVLTSDENNDDVEVALKELRSHVYNHMNTNLSAGATSIQHPVQLKFTYDRLVEAEKNRVSTTNEKIYANAQAVCEKQFPVGLSGSGRIPCIEDYVAKNGTEEQPIQDSLYKFNFTSPFWSPDLAGFALAVSLLLGIILIAKLSLDKWMKGQLHDHL